MSLVRRSLSLSSCGISHPSLGFKHHGFARSRTQLLPRSRSIRIANVVRSEEDGIEGSSADVASVALNQVAPPVGNAFGSSAKEVSIVEDPLGFFQNRLERKVQKVKQAFESVEEAVAPTPYSPIQGKEVVVFFCISFFLIMSFWLGNYVVPTWIFKETVFRNSGDDDVEESTVQDEKPSEEEVDPADLIELPPNLMPFRGAAVAGFKAGRQRAREAAEKRKKKAEKSK